MYVCIYLSVTVTMKARNSKHKKNLIAVISMLKRKEEQD